jgi:hypothetical protein
MALPAAYDVSFSFSGYQATNPNLPLPGQRVDTELANIEAALDGTQAALLDIRRSDGKLQNGIVTVDALAPGMTTGILPPTNWVTATSYTPLMSVWQASKLYQCIVAHVSGVFATDLAAGKWNLVVDFTVPVNAAAASATAAAGSATAAQNSATAAQGSASAASGSANAAAASAATALTQANRAQAEADRAQGISDTINASFAPLASPVFTGNPTAPTPAANDNDTSIATTAFVTAANTALKGVIVGTASAAMDTLGEVETAVNAKLASSAYTAADVLAKLLTVDGAGSLLDADLLDGQSSAFYLAIANLTGSISDAQHGNRGGGALHPAATAAVAGFMLDSASDGVTYGRKNGAWAATAAGLADAVSDGSSYGRLNATWAKVLPLAGGTLTGNITIAPAAGGADLTISAPAGAVNARLLLNKNAGTTGGNSVNGQVAGANRWINYFGTGAESGSGNSGSDFYLQRCSDAGAVIGTPIQINRSNGIVNLAEGLAVTGTMTLGGTPVALSTRAESIITVNGTTTYTVPAALKYLEVEALGPGGNGGSSASTGAATIAIGGNGGSGGIGKKLFSKAELGTSVSFVVAAPGSNGTSTMTPNGTAGAASVTAGSNGATGTAAGTVVTQGGAGGSASGWMLNGTGNQGDLNWGGYLGNPVYKVRGSGGSSPYGSGGNGNFLGSSTYIGADAVGFGSGGSGGSAGFSQASIVGGSGTGGFFLLREFY